MLCGKKPTDPYDIVPANSVQINADDQYFNSISHNNQKKIKNITNMGFNISYVMMTIREMGLNENMDPIVEDLVLDALLAKNLPMSNNVVQVNNPQPVNNNVIQVNNPQPVVLDNSANSLGVEEKIEGMCVVCWSCKINTVCIPCGHMALCFDCSPSLSHKPCPICRTPISQIIRTFQV